MFMIFLLICLTGCWNSQELDDLVLVQGVGLSKGEDNQQLKLTVEIIKPSGKGGQNAGESGGQETGQQIVLEQEAETYLEAARKLISYAKRRLHFDHTRVFVIHDELAKKEDFARVLDTIRRDRMLRLNSYFFVTEEEPINILSTPTLYESITSNELVSALDQTKYVSEFAPKLVREYFKSVEGPIPNAYIPMIKTQKNGDQVVTHLQDTAIIRAGQMVGKLNENETEGLNFLLNQVKGGSILITGQEKERATFEIKTAKTEIKPHLNGHSLKVDIITELEGTLNDNMTPHDVDKAFFNKLEEKVSKQVEKEIRGALDTLQELKADITDIGIKTYQKYPKQWQDISADWNNIFANADISINVNAHYLHEGLINKSIEQHQKRPDNNPYRFLKDLFIKEP